MSVMDEGHILMFADIVANGGELYRDATLLATQETLSISFDLNARKSCEFEPRIAENIAALYEAQRELERPEWVGRAVGIRRRSA